MLLLFTTMYVIRSTWASSAYRSGEHDRKASSPTLHHTSSIYVALEEATTATMKANRANHMKLPPSSALAPTARLQMPYVPSRLCCICMKAGSVTCACQLGFVQRAPCGACDAGLGTVSSSSCVKPKPQGTLVACYCSLGQLCCLSDR